MTKTLVGNPVRKSSRPAPDHTQDWRWFDEHLDEYRGKWVLVWQGQLVAANPDIRRLISTVSPGAYQEALVTYIPTEEEAQRVVL